VDLAGLKLGFQPTDNALLTLHYQRSEADLDFARPMLNYRTTNARTEDILTLKFDWQISERLDLFVKAYQHEWDTDYTRIYNTLDANGNVTGALRVINDNDYWGYDDDGLNAMLKYASAHGLEYIAGYDRQEFSGYDDVWRIGAQEETVDAWFGQVRTDDSLFENTMLAFGLRRNSPSNSADKTVWNFSGKHQLTDSLYLQSNIGTSFRLPDAEMLFLNEIYDEDNDGVPDDGYFAVGNPNLKPEQSENINISIGGTVGILRYELTGFQRDISDFIVSYTPIVIAGVEGESFANTNDEVEMEGFELSLSLPLGEHISARFSYTDTSAEMNGNGTQLQGIPENETKLHLDWLASSQAWGASLALNHVGNFTSRAQQRGNYTVVDLAGHLAFGSEREHRVVVRAENLTDKVYATGVGSGTRDAGGTYLYDNLGMERTFHASYTYSF
jgi:outer membrane cobalamin receptor